MDPGSRKPPTMVTRKRQDKFQSFYFYEVLENPSIIHINSLVCEKDLRFWELVQPKNIVIICKWENIWFLPWQQHEGFSVIKRRMIHNSRIVKLSSDQQHQIQTLNTPKHVDPAVREWLMVGITKYLFRPGVPRPVKVLGSVGTRIELTVGNFSLAARPATRQYGPFVIWTLQHEVTTNR